MRDFKKFKNYLFVNNERYEDAASKIGIAISSFAKKINGKTSWTYEELQKIRQTYKLTDEEFIDIFFDE